MLVGENTVKGKYCLVKISFRENIVKGKYHLGKILFRENIV
jgi:hypothetical protein